jgi:ATP-dependent DNA helicase DinG
VAAPGLRAASADASGGADISAEAARRTFNLGPVIVVHAALTARRLGLAAPPRSSRLLDVLELFAFVRPAAFCAPSATGLARALGAEIGSSLTQQASFLREGAAALLEALAGASPAERDGALGLFDVLARAGWAWAPYVKSALGLPVEGPAEGQRAGSLDVWSRLPEWEEAAPLGEPSSRPVAPEAARERLQELLNRAGLDEARPAQATFAAETAFAFGAREREGAPLMMLADAGTGVGKTLGYLASASLFAELNGPSVWISTFTRALQRQIEREARTLLAHADPRRRRVVVRKGRENYVCLLNVQEAAAAARQGGGDVIGVALVARWLQATIDGDMTGGDFPAWLPGLFAVGQGGQAGPASLVDRRGECVHAACAHYRTCFVEKSIRASRGADLVIANHALVLSQSAFDASLRARGRGADVETVALKRIVFDEGHHLFEAADAAFSACLSGGEAAELRRWIRGSEGRRRGRGLEPRLADLVAEDERACAALADALTAAEALPGEGWSGRTAALAAALPQESSERPKGPLETFFSAVLRQLAARADTRSEGGVECAARPATEGVLEAAAGAREALQRLETPLRRLAGALETLLDDGADTLDSGERGRLEGALRGLDRRARLQLPAWRHMLEGLETEAGDPLFVDWFEAVFHQNRVVDAAFRRHWVDPTEPLEGAVLRPAHGVLVTSATLADPAHEAPFALAEMRTGAARLEDQPRTLRLASPFDYARQARAIVVTDVAKDEPRRTAAALRSLFLASRGGGLGLFTAIRRLRAVYEALSPSLARAGLSLYAQHVDPLEISALIDIFRAEEDACLLGTDAVRDGVDVPGRSLRLLAFDRVPWPRPDLLHKARREKFGGRGFDDAIARARIAQAFGRLIRRAEDKGVFIMLDAAAPSRLFLSLPEGVTLERMGLSDAVAAVGEFLAEGEGPVAGARGV